MIKTFIVAAILIGLLVILALTLHRRPAAASLAKPPSIPVLSEPASAPRIIVCGWSRAELDRILSKFSSIYKLDPASTFVVDTASNDNLLITYRHDPEPDMLMFLINYLHYPHDFELKGRQLAVLASFVITSAYEPPEPSLVGMKAIVYVPADDTEYDLVYVQTAFGKTFEVPFTNLKWKPVELPRLSPSDAALRSFVQ
ncbi:MAG: hypothetical protein AB7O49_08585 [Sphingomonadales bacterium]